MPKPTPTAKQRIAFESKITPPGENGCMLWTGAKSRGYGYAWCDMSDGIGRRIRAHRLALYIAKSIWARPGQVIRHSCNNPACCNPDHLAIGTQKDNMQDAYRAGTRGHGELAGNAKLTWDKVEDIRIAYARGARQNALAAKYEVSGRNIGLIVSGKTWPPEKRYASPNRIPSLEVTLC